MPTWTARTLHAAALANLPLILVQGGWAKRQIPRLPAAPGPQRDDLAPKARRILVLGESTAVGVGAEHSADALAAQLSGELSRSLRAPLGWIQHGRHGLTVRAWERHFLASLPRVHVDQAVLVFGVNDSTALTPPDRYLQQLLSLAAALRQVLGPVPLVYTGVPPLDRFPALPWPLRRVLGWQSRALDLATEAAATHLPASCYVPIPLPPPALFAADGFHPNTDGYAAWAAQLAPRALALLKAT